LTDEQCLHAIAHGRGEHRFEFGQLARLEDGEIHA
jgi:hypothetical protein